MANNNKNDVIGFLIRAGLVVAAGYGVYRIVRGFSKFQPGEKVSDTALLTAATAETGSTPDEHLHDRIHAKDS